MAAEELHQIVDWDTLDDSPLTADDIARIDLIRNRKDKVLYYEGLGGGLVTVPGITAQETQEAIDNLLTRVLENS